MFCVKGKLEIFFKVYNILIEMDCFQGKGFPQPLSLSCSPNTTHIVGDGAAGPQIALMVPVIEKFETVSPTRHCWWIHS